MANVNSLTSDELRGHGPLVSVVIPAKNEEERLPVTLNALRSIMDREYQNLEIVIGVGISKDDTQRIAQYLANVVVSVGVGPSLARNQAARAASGEILVFLDADARPLPGTISRIVEVTDSNTVGTCALRPDVVNWRLLLPAKEECLIQ